MNRFRREWILPGLVLALGLYLPLGTVQAQGRGIQASAYSNNVGLSGRPTSTLQAYRLGTTQPVELKPSEPGYTGVLPEYQVTKVHSSSPQARKIQLAPTSSLVTQPSAHKLISRQVPTGPSQPRVQVIQSQGQSSSAVVQSQTVRVAVATPPAPRVQPRPATGGLVNLPPPGYYQENCPPPGYSGSGYPAARPYCPDRPPNCPDARPYGW